MRIACCITTFLVFTSILRFPQDAQPQTNIEKVNVLTTNICFPKGGLGIINPSLYVLLTSDKNKNELQLRQGDWSGLPSNKREVVIFSDDKVWHSNELPDDFNLSKAIVVSFEGPNVRFFDFHKMTGGYYERTPADPRPGEHP